eukprot:746112-Hanusia_phi.AAC.1
MRTGSSVAPDSDHRIPGPGPPGPAGDLTRDAGHWHRARRHEPQVVYYQAQRGGLYCRGRADLRSDRARAAGPAIPSGAS